MWWQDQLVVIGSSLTTSGAYGKYKVHRPHWKISVPIVQTWCISWLSLCPNQTETQTDFFQTKIIFCFILEKHLNPLLLVIPPSAKPNVQQMLMIATENTFN